VADHFEEVIGIRVAALETRVAAEADAVQEHFAEQQRFIAFSLTRQSEQLIAVLDLRFGQHDVRMDGLDRRIDGLDLRVDGLERRIEGLDLRVGELDRRMERLDQRMDGLERRMDSLDQRMDRFEHRLEQLERKVDIQFQAVKLLLSEILDRLPPAR
jgi:chromosome segregation ATPase